MSRFLSTFLVASLLFARMGYSEESPKHSSSELLKIANRPQEPKIPYPYREEEVYFANTAGGITLAGTLTLPQSQGPFPVVVLLHGSAPLDRDSSLFGHKPFLVWADYLTRQGIAVLRFDKRSAGKSSGNYSTSTIQDFASDALAAVEYLKTRQEINRKQIGLVGHSEGGMTASLAASKSDDIAFIVLMAAPCVNAEAIIHLQETLLQRADGVDEETILQNRKLRDQMLVISKKEKDREIIDRKLRDAINTHLSKLTAFQKKIAETYYGPFEKQIRLFNSTAFRYWLTYDPVTVLKKIKIPVLALNGELDFVVSSEQNLKQIVLTFESANHKDFTAIQFPKLNHMFQTCQTGSITEYANGEETTSPLVLNTMAEWILKRTSLKK